MHQVELLRTKLSPPLTRASLVARQRLLRRLDDALERSLTLLSAPAGFGKTTLLSAWITSLKESASPSYAVAWLSLDEGDNDPVRFWRYIIAACQQSMQTPIGASALSLLRGPDPLRLERVVTALLNDIIAVSQECVLIIEDYHLISSPQIHRSLSFLLEHLSANMHIVIATRNDPSLPLARLRARNAMIELRAADLRFSLAETQEFLNHVSGLQLASDDIARLDTHTEGWITGLQLLALLLQDGQDIDQFLADISNGHRHVRDYLIAEVFASQPEHVQTFLLQTSLFNRLTGSLCDAVTGRNDGESMLEDLERTNLFIVAFREDLQWYRYHAFFSEALRHSARRQLGPDCIEMLYSKASAWFEQHGHLEEAIETALRARAFPRAIALIELQAQAHGFRLDYTLHHWLEQLPQDLRSTNPLLCFLSAQHLLFSTLAVPGQRDAYLTLVEKAERLWQEEGNLPRLGSLYALRSLAAHWSGGTAQVLDYAGQALQWLSSEDTIWRGVALSTSGAAHRILGNAHAAYQALEEGYTLNDRAGYSIASLPTLNAMADILVLQGKLHQAFRLRQQVIERSGSFLVDSCEAHIRQGALYFEWNQLNTAISHLEIALAAEKRNEKGQPFAHAHLLLARINMARGELSQALELLQQLMMQATREQLPISIEELQAYQAWWSLTVGDQDSASHWRHTLDPQAIPTYAKECAYLVLARIMIMQGEPEEALPLLERWLAFSYAQGRSGSALAIAVLKARALYAMGESQQAQHTIAQVLALAQPERYTRIFLDEDITLAALLRTTRPRLNEPVLTTYVDTLLAAFEQERSTSAPLAHANAAALLPEPLSHHEQRVLRLLVAGLSNPEIANELVISINTVKTHVKNIYSKLNINSRKEARDVARRLKLL